jgi:hypothetical protein
MSMDEHEKMSDAEKEARLANFSGFMRSLHSNDFPWMFYNFSRGTNVNDDHQHKNG